MTWFTDHRLSAVIIGLLIIAVAIITVVVVRRQRYKKALRDRGWAFDSTPALPAVLDHQVPPFGLGFDRKVDELVSGATAAGLGFRSFEYTCGEGGPHFDQRLASVQLPESLPELFISSSGTRTGVRLPSVDIESGLVVRASDPNYARRVLSPAVLGAIRSFAEAGHRVDLSIDGGSLVGVGAPKQPDELSVYVEALAQISQAIDPNAVASYATPPHPAGANFYGRPDWVLVGRDDSLISAYGLTQTGFGHTTEKVIRSRNDGLPLDAFVHHWKTQRTESYTDSEGRTQTRTVTENHSETVCVVNMPFAFPLISIGSGWGGKRVKFESEAFNERFKVKTNNPKFTYDVIHPRTMEFMLAASPPDFRIEDHQLRFEVDHHDTLLIGFCADFAHELFGRIPSFVWANLDVEQPAFRRSSV